MPRLALVPTIVRETLGRTRIDRVPEPDLVMESDEQVAAYARAGRIDGAMAASYLFHSAAISQTIAGCREVVDLACGPATQLAQVAALNPDVRFLGVDLSPTMLESARTHVEALGLANVRFAQADITSLSMIADRSVDGVISTMALHHLPSVELLQTCFREIARVIVPGGKLYLADFVRLKSAASIAMFASMNADEQPPVFTLDYENSLRAAFSLSDLRAAAVALPHASTFTTFLMPFIAIVKTPSVALPPATRAQLETIRASLPARYLADLTDLRFFFKLGGLTTETF